MHFLTISKIVLIKKEGKEFKSGQCTSQPLVKLCL